MNAIAKSAFSISVNYRIFNRNIPVMNEQNTKYKIQNTHTLTNRMPVIRNARDNFSFDGDIFMCEKWKFQSNFMPNESDFRGNIAEMVLGHSTLIAPLLREMLVQRFIMFRSLQSNCQRSNLNQRIT